MDVLLAFLACLALGAPIGLAGSVLIGRGPELMAGLFHPNANLGWPHGVQEEDPPGGWTWRMPDSDTKLVGDDASKPPPESSSRDHASTRQASAVGEVRPEVVDVFDAPEARLEPVTGELRPGTNRVRPRW